MVLNRLGQAVGLLFGASTAGDDDYVVRVREFGVKASRELAAKMGGPNEAVAVVLAIALDAAHKRVW